MRLPTLKITHGQKHVLHRGLIHLAFLFFFCDLLACMFPAFDSFWHNVSRLGVALASVLATLSEYFVEEVPPPHT